MKRCKFCGKPIEGGLTGREKFCSERCKENFKKEYQTLWLRKKRKSNNNKPLSGLQTSASQFIESENVDQIKAYQLDIRKGQKTESETFSKFKKKISKKLEFSPDGNLDVECKGIRLNLRKMSKSVYGIGIGKGNNFLSLGFVKTEEHALNLIGNLYLILKDIEGAWSEE